MTSWKPDLASRGGPRYQALAEAIAEAVRVGELAPGAKLPPQRDLAWKLKVTVGTVGRAYALAEQRRLVSGHVGRGTFVLDPAGDPTADTAPDGGVLDLTRNTPTVSIPASVLGATLEEMSRMPGLGGFLGYMSEAAERRYRLTASSWMKRVALDAAPERIVLTCGAQHALAVALLTLAKPGDTVLTERMTFNGVADAIQLGGGKPLGVAMDDEGALPEAIDRAARQTGAKLIFLTPTIHSPTTSVMGAKRRRAVAEVLRARQMILIEDDVYGYLSKERSAPIATLTPDHTIYIASMSKCMAPGLRVAWLAAPPHLVERLTDTLHATTLGLPAFGPEIVARWIESGTAERIVDALRAETELRHGMAAAAFRDIRWRGRPDSMHAFVELPESWRAGDFAAEAERRGVRICTAAQFAIEPEAAPNAIRVALCAMRDRETLRRALDVLSALLHARPAESAETLRRRVV